MQEANALPYGWNDDLDEEDGLLFLCCMLILYVAVEIVPRLPRLTVVSAAALLVGG